MQKQILVWVTIVSAILLIVSILVQQKGGGLGSTFGGDGGAYRTKRGAEKFVFYATIVMSFIFCGSIILSYF